jgi:UDP-GlcNAc:undecaprenyl-phosphate GlcNAc-1-phosphate transferase
LVSGQYFIAAISIVLSGACIGFLFWNRNPARIYMGDAGALFLGMMIASLLVRFEPNPINRLASFSIPIFILAIPILDTTVAVLSRLRRGKSPFEGGKDHLSHRLTRRGLTRKKTAFTLWFLTGFYVLIAVVISSVSYRFEGLLVFVGLMSWLGLFFFFLVQRDE